MKTKCDNPGKPTIYCALMIALETTDAIFVYSAGTCCIYEGQRLRNESKTGESADSIG